ncbi:MAG: DUF362 domain-containing protein [Endomicrobiia bacterium]
MPKVFFSSSIKPESVVSLLDAIPVEKFIFPDDFCAIKIHFGEKGNTGYVKPEFVRPIVKKLNSIKAKLFLTDANTIYAGVRANAIDHIKVAVEHGFSLQKLGCPVIIADGLRGNSGVEVEINQKHFKSVKIANAIYYSDSFVFVTHFKGHEITGFGGALKNIGMGCATRAGKYEMHNSVVLEIRIENCKSCGICVRWCPTGALSLPDKNSKIIYNKEKCIGCGECIISCKYDVFKIPWSDSTKDVQEKIVEYCFGVLKNKRAIYINFLNFITKYCDCYSTKEGPLIEDIGIVVSSDPVAVDKASVDLVNKKYGRDFFKEIWPEIDWSVQLEYAEKLGLGSRNYELVEI